MEFKTLNIIGAGPNCIYALEILLKKILKTKNHTKRKICIFEKTGLIGGRTHSYNLSKNILLNRVAGQISLGSYPFNRFPKSLSKFDYNFMQWKNNHKDIKIKRIKSHSWPPRSIFGLSLNQKFFDLLKIYSSKTNISIEIYFDNIVSLKIRNKKIELETQNKKKFTGDKVLIVTGNYISSNKSTKLNHNLSKLVKNTKTHFEHNFLDKLDNENYWKNFNKKNIIIYGTGVSSLDVIMKLTQKKNKIFPISRTFLFPFARPLNQKLTNPKKLEHKGILFDEKLVNFIKKKFLSNNSEFGLRNTLLPFIKSEFYLIYFQKFMSKRNYDYFSKLIKKELSFIKKNKYKLVYPDKKIDDFLRKFVIEKKFNKKFYTQNWFSKSNILNDIVKKKISFFDIFANPLLSDKENFKKEYIKFLKWDIKEASNGNLNSPFKKACDGLWRDLRPYFTKLFDDCENKKIYAEFVSLMLPIHNRLADGPSLEIIKKIRKLINNKIINFNYKENFKFKRKKSKLIIYNHQTKTSIDYIFSAIANIYKEKFIGDKLIQSMLKNNIISLKRNRTTKRQFLNLNKFQQPINNNNKVNNNITFIGPASEGTKFFHHTLSRPDKKQFNIVDLENWVKKL